MDLSVVIPTRGRPDELGRCLTALARQTLAPGRYEVLVGFDGPDPDGEQAARRAWDRAAGAASLTIQAHPKEGQASVRNRLLAIARGRILVTINDDVLPDPGFLEAHLVAHEEQRTRPAIVVGHSPWRVHEPSTLFDRLVKQTSMVFFYDRMNTPEALADRERDWGFRHAWGLNCSIPLGAVREVGGFTVFPATYGYEDDELAFRLQQRFGMPVLYRPEARAEHDHRLSPREYLSREYALGYAAWGFAATTPECAAAMFGRDVRSADELAYSREFVRREAPTAARLERAFVGLSDLPAAIANGPSGAAMLELLYGQHLLLKRWCWRRGLLDASEERMLDRERASPAGGAA